MAAMKSPKNLIEIIVFLEDVLGKNAAEVFEENMDEFVYFVRSEALHNTDITETKMRSRLRKLAEGIIAASVKRFLNENYADDNGEVELNINDDGIYDRNMKPISAIEKIRKTQRDMMSLMVSRGMYEFAKGRHLARIMDSRAADSDDKKEANPKDINWTPPAPKTTLLELAEIEVMRLERKLPNLTPEEAVTLASLYLKLRTSRHSKARVKA